MMKLFSEMFLWAERNSGSQGTEIKWTDLSLGPLAIGGPVGSAPFTLPEYLVSELGNPLYSSGWQLRPGL